MKIDSFAFSGCENLKQIQIPKSVTTIGSYAFDGCKNLHRIELGKNSRIKEININAFQNTNITQLQLPNGINLVLN